MAEAEERVGEKVTENQRKILELINKNPYISVREISEVIGISQRKTEENVAKIKAKRDTQKSWPRQRRTLESNVIVNLCGGRCGERVILSTKGFESRSLRQSFLTHS